MIAHTLYLILGFSLAGLALVMASNDSVSLKMRLKVGVTDSAILLQVNRSSADPDSGASLFINILVANSFQVALSTTYFLYTSLYTAQCAASEWSSYIRGELKPLRVSCPSGQQISTCYLQLPYRYGIPLMIMLTSMHFLASQSIFVARLQYYMSDGSVKDGGYNADGGVWYDSSFSDVGCSSTATITACCVGLVLIVAQVINSCRHLDNRISIHGNSSAVISALCHAEQKPADAAEPNVREQNTVTTDQAKLSTQLLNWGVTKQPRSTSNDSKNGLDCVGHYSFSADLVELPQGGRYYR